VTTIVWTLFIRLLKLSNKVASLFCKKKGTMMHNVHNILENQDKDKSDFKGFKYLTMSKM